MKDPRKTDDKPNQALTDMSLEDMCDKMDLGRGDVYARPDGSEPRKVVGFQTNGDVFVTNPTVAHEQDPESGQWTIPIHEIYESWFHERIVPKRIDIVDE